MVGQDSPEILSQMRTSQGLTIQLRRDPVGVLDVPAFSSVVVGVHLGAPTRLGCRRDGRRFLGTAVHGAIDIIPPGIPSRWEIYKNSDTALFLGVPKHFLDSVACQLDVSPEHIEIQNKFQIRDKELENLTWAIKREMELGFPSGRLYLDGLSLAIVSRLIMQHSSHSEPGIKSREGISDRRLSKILAFVEEHLSENISLEEIALSADLSASHLKAIFSKGLGLPVHQYVIQRRVERAKELLIRTNRSISEIALDTGFAHQSHLARHMRRVLGVAPRAVRLSAAK